MRYLAIWRLAAILLIAAVPLGAATIAASAPAVLADNGKGNNGNQGDDNDGNRGHGNDPDGVDEDNPGKSGDAKPDKNDAGDKDAQVEAIPAGYVVAVDCQPTMDGVATTCAFTATAPEGGKKVGFLQVPDETLCAEVIGTDAKHDDPEPHTNVSGYVSSGGDKETVTIELDGAVTTGGTATYWIKAASAVFPVTGPGLTCNLAAEPAGAEATVTFSVTPAATAPPATGTVAVEVLSCAGVPADPASFDWFGQCQPGVNPPRDFSLAPSDDGTSLVTATTDETGAATFADLAPGDYRLDLVDGSWCHANADRVTADSEVIVEAGATSTVWIFVCDDKSGV